MNVQSLLALIGLAFFQTLFQACFHPVFASLDTPSEFAWTLTKTEWSSQDEKSFQELVTRLGEAVEARQCQTVSDCMKSSANTYFKSDAPGLLYKSDCADFPYFLRAYFAWKNHLPFSFATEMKLRDVPGNQGLELRYSRYGNEVAERYSVESVNGKFKDAQVILNDWIPNTTSSANYRTHYADSKTDDHFTDFYPVFLSRDTIRPGSLIYDPNGHVAMVYKVSDDGKIFYIDAHPDNSLSTGTYGSKFVRSNPGQGAGFKNWRPLKLVGAELDAQGYYLGGQIRTVANSELADLSSEQFFGNSGAQLPDDRWSEGKFLLNGQILSYYDYLRQKMSKGNLQLNPLGEFNFILKDVCDSLKDRVGAVDVALKAGVQNRKHPLRLPENIYGATGEWETYSTPSRDAQLKVSFADLLNQSRDFLRKWKEQDPGLSYSGSDLAQDLLQVYWNEARSCEISYTNSIGQAVSLNLEEVRQRLFALSFDPYHCAELRWGATTIGELQTCADSGDKRLWYEREQRLRNQHIRQYELKMDFTLEDLLQPLPGNGVEHPPDVDIVDFLRSQTSGTAN